VSNSEPLLVTAFLAAPLDGVPAVRCSVEMSVLVQALHDSGAACAIDAIRPPKPALIAQQASKGVLHVTCHGSDDGLELQDAAGRSVCYTGPQFAEAIGGEWQLVVLNGCDTSPVGEIVNARLGISVVCTTGFVADEAAERFTEVFYRDVAAGAHFGSAADRANGQVNTQWLVVYHFLPGRVERITTRPGQFILKPGFKPAVQSTLCTRPLAPSRRGLLVELFQGLCGPLRGVAVSGPPRSGVSTLLRACSDYFGWLSRYGPYYVDARQQLRDEDLTPELTNPDGWVVIDHFSEASATIREAVLGALGQSPADRPRILLGSQAPPETDRIEGIALSPLTDGEAEDWLRRELGRSAEEWTWLVEAVEAWPGRLQSLLPRMLSGASRDEILALLAEGDPESSLKPTVDALWSNPQMRTALCCFAAYPMSPRTLAKKAWVSALRVADDIAADESFSQILVSLNRRGLIRIPEVIVRTGSITTYVAPEPDAAAIIRRRRVGMLTPAQLTRIREVMLQGLEEAHLTGALDANGDWLWVTYLLMACKETGAQEDRALAAIYPHLDRGGDMLRGGDAAKQRMIVDAAFDVARHIGSWDKAAQLALVRGQMRYQTGNLLEAEKEFRKILRMPVSSSRKLQAHRALGQVAYRRADYAGALRCYARAQRHAGEADAFVVTTLLQESGKALSRLGRGPEAVANLREALRRRSENDGVREVAKAQHELARALLRLNELPEARELFESALQGSLAAGDEKWALGPLYHLFLIELESDNIPGARSKLEELRHEAARLHEQLWMTFGELGSGMLLFAEQHYEGSRAVIGRALTDAATHRYGQVAEDARDWVRKRCMRVMNLVGPTLASSGIAEILSLVEAVPVGKAQKALRYSAYPNLVRSVQVELQSDHETRHLRWTNREGWSCTCALFVETGRCSHIVSVLLRGVAPTSY